MSTLAPPPVRVATAPLVREARPADNPALLALAAACPMEAELEICVDREPDFFALNRLEGDDWRVGVVDAADGGIAGCVAVARRVVHLHGVPAATQYVGDLKVHPNYRGGPVADALTRWARDACHAAGGADVPTLITVLDGNRAMQRRTGGPRGLPRFTRFATIRSHAVPLLRRRAAGSPSVRVSRAAVEDVEEMAELWGQVARGRQFAPVLDAGAMRAWIDAAPGLELSCYRLARRADRRIAGFLAVWDQAPLKQLRVTGYSLRLGTVRGVFNAAAPFTRATPLPAAGEPLRCATVANLCVPVGEPEVLRALLIAAYNSLIAKPCSVIGRRYSFLNIGLDVRDPLRHALRGLLAQPTDVAAYVTTPAGHYGGRTLGDRPLHYEIALV